MSGGVTSENPQKRLVKRVRRRVMGGRMDMRVYSDGSVRARMDHPSNDPEIEMAMAGRFYRVAREAFASVGLGEPILGPISWRNDPEVSGDL